MLYLAREKQRDTTTCQKQSKPMRCKAFLAISSHPYLPYHSLTTILSLIVACKPQGIRKQRQERIMDSLRRLVHFCAFVFSRLSKLGRENLLVLITRWFLRAPGIRTYLPQWPSTRMRMKIFQTINGDDLNHSGDACPSLYIRRLLQAGFSERPHSVETRSSSTK